MKNKILSYLFGGIFAVLFMSSYVYAKADPCSKCSGISDPEANYKCLMECADPCSKCSGISDPEANYKCLMECAQEQECPNGCCGIKLNTDFPIIGNCIGDSPDENETNAFPTMIGAITKIVMSLVFVVCFILIIYAGILRAANKPSDAKKWLIRVAVTILLLGFSGAILRLINPNFFS